MHKFHTKQELQKFIAKEKKNGKNVGFVPTMGALHKGHLSLITESLAKNELVVCSIFVNPTQFNNQEDLDKYPRVEEQDLLILKNAGCHAVFLPKTEEMYTETVVSDRFNFGELGLYMEGKHRPGHFEGMATIVKKLLEIVQPKNAYFGEKDFQQLLIIKKLVEQESIPVNIVGCPIVREVDGLAMSSRNMRLSANERQEAPAIYQALLQIKERATQNKDFNRTIAKAIETINSHPRLAVEYLEICNAQTLKPISNWDECKSVRAFVSVFIGQVKVIDNILLF